LTALLTPGGRLGVKKQKRQASFSQGAESFDVGESFVFQVVPETGGDDAAEPCLPANLANEVVTVDHLLAAC
jgi:hypothetical protein